MTMRAHLFGMLFAVLCTAGAACRADDSVTFIHPGLLHSSADLARLKNNVRDHVEPWAGAWKAFTTNNRWLAPNYTPRPLAIVGRGVGAAGQTQISNDCTAAYYNAIAWTVTGDEAYAKKSIQIMDAWASTCTQINGKDAVLCAGIYGYKLMNAAEIIRATCPGWSPREVAQFKHLARDVFSPVIQDFATFANGNWDAAADAAMISIAVFLDDRPMFDRAVRYYLAGSGNGSLDHYILNDTGQLQETGRDQAHSQLGIGLLSCVAETAWHQGIDLYSADDHRLLQGFEYTAQYNLGEDVPFVPTHDRTGNYTHVRPSARGKPDMAIYEMVYNHYVNRMNIPAPFTAQAAALHRPEPLAIDQVGAGTLLFSLPPYHAQSPVTKPALAGPLIASSEDHHITLRWPASIGATTYILSRAATLNGPYELIAPSLTALRFTDTAAAKNHVSFYRLRAANALGHSDESLPAAASAGLPAPWTSQDIGLSTTGHTDFDGATFTLQAKGDRIGGPSDQCLFIAAPLPGDGGLIARYVPPTPSQFATFGLMIRASSAADAPAVALIITPEALKAADAPHWHVEFRTRAANAPPLASPAPPLAAPIVTWNRLMAPLWLRLQRTGTTIEGATSPDGETWTPLDPVTLPLPPTASIGLAGCSRIQEPTTIMFDHVSIISPTSKTSTTPKAHP